MTGRELINYILSNHLENERMFVQQYENDYICGLIKVDDVVAKVKQPKCTVLREAEKRGVQVFEINGIKYMEDILEWQV